MDGYHYLQRKKETAAKNNIQKRKAGAETECVVRRNSCFDDLHTSHFDFELVTEIDCSTSDLSLYVGGSNFSFGVDELVFSLRVATKDCLVATQRTQSTILCSSMKEQLAG